MDIKFLVTGMSRKSAGEMIRVAWIAFIGGCFLGLILGVTLMCLLQINRDDDRQKEEHKDA